MPKIRGYVVENVDNTVGVPSTTVTFRRKADTSTFVPDATDISTGQYDKAFDDYPGRIYTDISVSGRRVLRRGEVTGQIDELWMSDLDNALAMLGFEGVDARTLATAFKVSAGVGLNVVVAAGESIILGHPYITVASQTLAIAANAGPVSRLDRVVVRLERGATTDANAGKITVAVKTGTFASGAAVLPSLTQSADIWEMALATVTVPVSASSIVNANIADERVAVSAHRALTVAPGSIVTGSYAPGSITNAAMGPNSVDSDQYVDGSIDPEHLSADVYASLRAATWSHFPVNPDAPWIDSTALLTTSPTTGINGINPPVLLSITTGRTYMVPFLVPVPMTVQRLAYVGDRLTGMRMALIASGVGTLNPTGTVYPTTANAGVPEFATLQGRVDFVYTVPLVITPGLYWVAMNWTAAGGDTGSPRVAGYSTVRNTRISLGKTDITDGYTAGSSGDWTITPTITNSTFRDQTTISTSGAFGVLPGSTLIQVGIKRHF